MKLNVQSIHFTADSKLLDFIQKKADKLEMFFDHIIDGDVFLKLDKADNSANKITEIKLHLPGQTIFAKEQCTSFEEATDLVMESLQKQLKRHKERLRGHEVELMDFDEMAD